MISTANKIRRIYGGGGSPAGGFDFLIEKFFPELPPGPGEPDFRFSSSGDSPQNLGIQLFIDRYGAPAYPLADLSPVFGVVGEIPEGLNVTTAYLAPAVALVNVGKTGIVYPGIYPFQVSASMGGVSKNIEFTIEITED